MLHSKLTWHSNNTHYQYHSPNTKTQRSSFPLKVTSLLLRINITNNIQSIKRSHKHICMSCLCVIPPQTTLDKVFIKDSIKKQCAKFSSETKYSGRLQY